jgi:hypothetical protein
MIEEVEEGEDIEKDNGETKDIDSIFGNMFNKFY